MRNSYNNLITELQQEIVNRLIALVSFLGIPLGLLLTYRVVISEFNPLFAVLAVGLYATPALYLYRTKISLAIKFRLLLLLACSFLALNIYNQGLLS